MARYPHNFTQTMPAEMYATLPKLATYEGDAPDLKHLLGLQIPTHEIERVVYVGERENVYVENADGVRSQPWKGVWITEFDAHGKPVVRGYDEPPVKASDPAKTMSTADLAARGFTDATLGDLARELLGVSWEPDRLGPSAKRLAMYQRVMAAAHG